MYAHTARHWPERIDVLYRVRVCVRDIGYCVVCRGSPDENAFFHFFFLI